MNTLFVYAHGLYAVLIVAVLTWVLSVLKRNVAIVDSVWSLMFILAGLAYAFAISALSPRATLTLALVSVWGLRLALHITWRNWRQGEDRRYQAIRTRNEPHFALKSFYLISLFQAMLSWVISLSLLGAVMSSDPLGLLDYLGIALWLVGFLFEAGAWWSTVGPILMSVLLMRVSGVVLLEKDISERRPQYADYIRHTNAFFPWIAKSGNRP